MFRCSPLPSRGQQHFLKGREIVYFGDAARTPHGDSNKPLQALRIRFTVDAARSPHGDSNGATGNDEHDDRRCSPHPSRGQQLRAAAEVAVRTGRCSPRPSRGQQQICYQVSANQMHDAARTPHGDSNCIQSPQIRLTVFDAARPPHGDSNSVTVVGVVPVRPDAARTPHGDSSLGFKTFSISVSGMQPAPLTGTATTYCTRAS